MRRKSRKRIVPQLRYQYSILKGLAFEKNSELFNFDYLNLVTLFPGLFSIFKQFSVCLVGADQERRRWSTPWHLLFLFPDVMCNIGIDKIENENILRINLDETLLAKDMSYTKESSSKELKQRTFSLANVNRETYKLPRRNNDWSWSLRSCSSRASVATLSTGYPAWGDIGLFTHYTGYPIGYH